jgi:hypothetical protein
MVVREAIYFGRRKNIEKGMIFLGDDFADFFFGSEFFTW